MGDALRSRPATAARLALIVFICVATFPAASQVGSPGLDGSWILEINRLHFSRFSFGRDAAYTYGPLGYLLYPADMGSHALQAAMVRALLQLLTGVLLARRLLDAPWTAIALCAAGLLASAALQIEFEYQIIFFVALLAADAADDRSGRSLIALAVAAALCMFMKFTIGVTAVALWSMSSALLLRNLRGPGLRPVMVAAGAFAATLVIAAQVLLSSAADLGGWLSTSVSIAAGYDSMSLWGPAAEVALAWMALLVFLALATFAVWRRSRTASTAVVCAIALFVAHKHAFVRHDDHHAILFFPLALAALGAVAAAARGRTDLVATAAALGLTVAPGSWLLSRNNPAWSSAHAASCLLGRCGARNLGFWVDRDEVLRRLHSGDAQVSEKKIADLPAVLASRGAESFGVVPFELSVCVANRIDCTPTPTLQTFSAYTARLDLRTAAHFAGDRAPDVLLAHFDAIDGRSLVMEAPATWRAITANYQSLGETAAGVLLARSPRRADPGVREIDRSSIEPGHWIDIPRSTGVAAVGLKFELSSIGQLLKFAYKVPPVFIALRFEGGRVDRYRLVPDTARNGIPLDDIPAKEPHAARLMEFQLDDDATPDRDFARFLSKLPPRRRPLQFAIDGPGVGYYRQPLPITWMGDR